MILYVYRDNYPALELVGRIETHSGAGERFAYAPAYLERSNTQPISVSLPLSETPFEAKALRPYFEGLLPEEGARRRLARALGVKETSYLRILGHVGLECIGDVVIADRELAPDYLCPAYESCSPMWLSEQSGGEDSIKFAKLQVHSRLSLAGAQTKTGLYHEKEASIEQGWHLPIESAPSTHIVKTAHAEFPDLGINEYLCMSAARLCGLKVPRASIIATKQPLFCVERYDRAIPNNPIIVDGLPVPQRLHQEDLCQAFGIRSGGDYKYQEYRWDGLRGVARFLYDNAVLPAEDITELLRITVFSYLIGNCDNHLKNLSIVYRSDWSDISLAPAYDLVSTTYYQRLERDMAMRIGKHRDIDLITPDDFEMLASDIGLSSRLVAREARSIAEQLESTFDEAASDALRNGVAQATAVRDAILRDAEKRIQLLTS